MASHYIISLVLAFVVCSEAHSAEISIRGDTKYDNGCVEKHHLYLQGDIEQGDRKKIESRLAELDKRQFPKQCAQARGTIVLHLDSDGGSFAEALQILDLLVAQYIETKVDANEKCFSACAIVFFAGNDAADAQHVPNRKMDLTAQVGLHAPFLEIGNRSYEKEVVEGAYDLAIKNIAELIRRSSDIDIDPVFLPEFLEKGRLKFLMIDDVDKIGRFRVTVPIPQLKFITPQMISNYCVNAHEWEKKRKSVPFKSDPQPALRTNGQQSYKELTQKTVLNFQVRKITAGNGPTNEYRLRYLLPAVQEDEGTVDFCIFDVVQKASGEISDYSCVGFLNGGAMLASLAGLWPKILGKNIDFKPETSCAGAGAFAFAPPDTPIAEIPKVLATYQSAWNR